MPGHLGHNPDVGVEWMAPWNFAVKGAGKSTFWCLNFFSCNTG